MLGALGRVGYGWAVSRFERTKNAVAALYPHSGEGYGAKDFSSSGLVVDMAAAAEG